MTEVPPFQELPELKYKKFSHDWDELPIRANGAAMAIYITVATTLISTKLLHPNASLIVPCAIYFFGLLFAFATHTIHFTLDGDMDQKQRISDGFAWIIDVQKLSGLPDQIRMEADTFALTLAEERERLFTAPTIQRLKTWSAYTYFLSLVAFLVASLVVFAYFWLYLSSQS